MSTNWAGSTVLGLVIGSHPSAAFLGEPAMIVRRDSQGKWRHQEFCSTCGVDSPTPCPIWNPALIAQVRATPDRVYDTVAERLPSARFFVDSSKNKNWLEAAVQRGNVNAKVIHISKAVHRFAGSALNRRKTRGSIEAIGWHWAKDNQEIRDLAAARNLDYLHVRYADFARDVAGTLLRVGEFLNYQPDARQAEFWTYPHHFVKGNPGTATHFDEKRIESQAGLNRDLYRENHRMIFLDDKWKELMTPDELSALCSMPEVRREMEILGHKSPDYRPAPFARRVRGRFIAGASNIVDRMRRLAGR
ncbi:MAG TPA: hypothetical protein VGH74_07365 [Planctomycetaceae bacterium]